MIDQDSITAIPQNQEFSIQKFNHIQFSELTTLTDPDGKIWFIGREVATKLGYTNPMKAVRDRCKGVNSADLPTSGGVQCVRIIPEGDFFRLVMRSTLPMAEEFQDWVCDDVLPAIRERGSYLPLSVVKTGMAAVADDLDATVRICKVFGLEGNQALLSANTAVKKLRGVDCMALAGVTHLVAEKQIQHFTPTIIGKKYGLSAMKTNKAIEAAGFQIAQRDHKNRIIWIVTDAGKAHAQLSDTNKKHSDGSPIM